MPDGWLHSPTSTVQSRFFSSRHCTESQRAATNGDWHAQHATHNGGWRETSKHRRTGDIWHIGTKAVASRHPVTSLVKVWQSSSSVADRRTAGSSKRNNRDSEIRKINPHRSTVGAFECTGTRANRTGCLTRVTKKCDEQIAGICLPGDPLRRARSCCHRRLTTTLYCSAVGTELTDVD
jgi:hypothetical protein